MQELIDTLSQGWRAERSLSQMTLGNLIKELEKHQEDKMIKNAVNLHSYRGYYCDLAIQPAEGERLVRDLIKDLKESLGNTFTGYKGGDFYMNEHTPMWLANYGNTGLKIVGIIEGDVLSFKIAEDN